MPWYTVVHRVTEREALGAVSASPEEREAVLRAVEAYRARKEAKGSLTTRGWDGMTADEILDTVCAPGSRRHHQLASTVVILVEGIRGTHYWE